MINIRTFLYDELNKRKQARISKNFLVLEEKYKNILDQSHNFQTSDEEHVTKSEFYYEKGKKNVYGVKDELQNIYHIVREFNFEGHSLFKFGTEHNSVNKIIEQEYYPSGWLKHSKSVTTIKPISKEFGIQRNLDEVITSIKNYGDGKMKPSYTFDSSSNSF